MSDVPVIHFNQCKAKLAFEAYAAMVMQEARQPSLKDNAAWMALRAEAYATFYEAFEKSDD